MSREQESRGGRSSEAETRAFLRAFLPSALFIYFTPSREKGAPTVASSEEAERRGEGHPSLKTRPAQSLSLFIYCDPDQPENLSPPSFPCRPHPLSLWRTLPGANFHPSQCMSNRPQPNPFLEPPPRGNPTAAFEKIANDWIDSFLLCTP